MTTVVEVSVTRRTLKRKLEITTSSKKCAPPRDEAWLENVGNSKRRGVIVSKSHGDRVCSDLIGYLLGMGGPPQSARHTHCQSLTCVAQITMAI